MCTMASKTTKTTRGSKNFLMEESLRIAVQKDIENFIADEDALTLQFPISFSNSDRGFVHKYVQAKGLKSKSHGKGTNRCLTIYKPNTNTHVSYEAELNISGKSINVIKDFLKENGVTNTEVLEAKELGSSKLPKQYNYAFAIFKLSIPPRIIISHDIIDTHVKLPITNYREEIIDMINKNRVLVISGDTGSGKTTQVPQYILNDYCVKNEPCRIICTQPRRIAAVSMADRVAYERSEIVGNAVGYQIRLESKISPTSNLIYTTSGFLLRCLISDSSANWLSRVTHIIMDEVHERDRYTDFLFIAVKEAINQNPKLKIILMSATIDTNIFTKYFDCPLLKIPGRMHPVDIYQLEDVLGMLGYSNKQIENDRSKLIGVQKEQLALPKLPLTSTPFVDEGMTEMVNETLQECFYGHSDFDQFFYLVSGEGVDVNIKHSDTDLNALTIAAINGLPDVIETLLRMGADPKITGAMGFTAKEWAQRYGHPNCVELLDHAEKLDPRTLENDERNKENQKRLQLYLDQTNETEIDHGLLFDTIKYIHEQMPEGGILVFLPGYDAILEQMNTINEGNISSNIEVLFLHGNMETNDQRRVFARAAAGCRKIILSTNIAETSLTIDDVVYVVDCGKVKQISYDSLSESTSLTSTWISKACAKQRMGRAGRTRAGFCYRLYSKQRFNAMEEFTLPELLRIPLTELCLHARIMTKTTISDYLSKALQPPPSSTVNQSIKLLKTIGALNENEDVTKLGYRLVDLPVDVQLGKMLLYSIHMKCLDPVLTIVSALSVKDPFVLSFENEIATNLSRKTLADDSCSDLMVFIKLYQLWMQHKAKGKDYQFCRENRVSNGIMELIHGFRSQILGQLRTVGFILPRGPNDMSDLNQNSNNFAVVKACFVGGFYPNVCRVDRKVGNLKSKQEKKVLPHVTSVLRDRNTKSQKSILSNLPSEWIVFEEKSRVERLCLVRNNSVVLPLAIALFGGPMYMAKNNIIPFDDNSDSESDEPQTVKFVIDDWIYFVLQEDTAKMIQQLRIKLNAMFMRTLCNSDSKPGAIPCNNKIIDIVSCVLITEDDEAGFVCQKDVGVRPLQLPMRQRDKNRLQKSNVAQRSPNHQNGIQFVRGYQQGSHFSSYQPQQRSNNPQRNNMSNNTQNKSIVYRKNSADSSNCGLTGTEEDFDIYLSHFTSQINLKPKRRYFVLFANSKEVIVESYKSNKRWQYSKQTLKQFKTIKSVKKDDVDIVLFFLIPNCKFYSMGRLNLTGNYLQIECLAAKEVSFVEAKNINVFCKPLETFYDGEEVFSIDLAEKLFRLFLRKLYDSRLTPSSS